MADNPNTQPEGGQPVQMPMIQQHVDREVRLLIGDLGMAAVFAKARVAELELLLMQRDQQIAALTAGKPKVVKEG